MNQHILFLDEDEKDIDLAEKFGTEPELLDRPHNRIRTEQLEVSHFYHIKCSMNF